MLINVKHFWLIIYFICARLLNILRKIFKHFLLTSNILESLASVFWEMKDDQSISFLVCLFSFWVFHSSSTQQQMIKTLTLNLSEYTRFFSLIFFLYFFLFVVKTHLNVMLSFKKEKKCFKLNIIHHVKVLRASNKKDFVVN
jgi:hypothetical protein